MTDQIKIDPFIQNILDETAQVIGQIGPCCGSSIEEAAVHIIQAFRGGRKLLICGNGGSAADSQHIAAEMVVRFQKERTGLPAVALTTDTSILTACSNDYGFEHVFEKQVEALGREGDVFMGLSTSGTSENIILAMKKAKSKGLFCIAMRGEKQGPLDKTADVSIGIPSQITARVQEGHLVVAHILCDMVEQRMFP